MSCTIVYAMLSFSCILRPMNFKMRYLQFKSDGWIFFEYYEVERRREEEPVRIQYRYVHGYDVILCTTPLSACFHILWF